MENTEEKIIPSRKPIKKMLGWIIWIAALFFCVGAIWKYWGQFREHSGEVSPWLIVAGAFGTLVSYAFESWAWHILVKEINGGVRFVNSFRAWSYSQVAKYIPGKVMVLVMRHRYCSRDGMRPSKVAAAVVLEIVLSLVCAVSITIIASLWTGVTWGLSPWLFWGVLAVLLVIIHPWTIKTGMRYYYKLRKIDLSETPELTLWGILKPLGIYFVAWVFYGLGGYWLMKALGITAIDSAADLGGIVGAFTLAWAGGYLFLPAPGGAGAREAVLIFTLKPWVDPLGVRAIIAILARFCQSGMDLLFAGTCWLIGFIASRTKKNDTNSTK